METGISPLSRETLIPATASNDDNENDDKGEPSTVQPDTTDVDPWRSQRSDLLAAPHTCEANLSELAGELTRRLNEAVKDPNQHLVLTALGLLMFATACPSSPQPANEVSKAPPIQEEEQPAESAALDFDLLKDAGVWKYGGPGPIPMVPSAIDDPNYKALEYWGPSYQFFENGRYVFIDATCKRSTRVAEGSWSVDNNLLVLEEDRRIDDKGGDIIESVAAGETHERLEGPGKWRIHGGCFLHGYEPVVVDNQPPTRKEIRLEKCSAEDLGDGDSKNCMRMDGQPYWISSDKAFLNDRLPIWFEDARRGYPLLNAGDWHVGRPEGAGYSGSWHQLDADGTYTFDGGRDVHYQDCAIIDAVARGRWTFEKGTLRIEAGALDIKTSMYDETDAGCQQATAEVVRRIHEAYGSAGTREYRVEKCIERTVVYERPEYDTYNCHTFDDIAVYDLTEELARDREARRP